MRRIHAPAHHILQLVSLPKRIITILWVPAHCGHPGNTDVCEQACALVNRAVDGLPSFRSARECLLTYQEITLHYRNSRMIYPPAHKSMSRTEQIVWRQLQMAALISPFLNSQIHKGDVLPLCCLCSSPRADFNHIYRNCLNKAEPPPLRGLSDRRDGRLLRAAHDRKTNCGSYARR
uniref:Tick transposon n=1 Tax=Rhipicephalus appendiculatus TaxID=34631 RepID=A0A131YUV5_RHIAP